MNLKGSGMKNENTMVAFWFIIHPSSFIHRFAPLQRCRARSPALARQSDAACSSDHIRADQQPALFASPFASTLSELGDFSCLFRQVWRGPHLPLNPSVFAEFLDLLDAVAGELGHDFRVRCLACRAAFS